MKKPGKRSFRQAIEETGGVISDIAEHFGCTNRTIYNWLDHYEMRPELERARTKMRSVAHDIIYEDLIERQSVSTAMWVLNRYNDQNEALQLDSDVLQMMEALGFQPSEAVLQFQAMIRQMYEQKAGD